MVNLLPIQNQQTVAWERRRRILLVVLLFSVFSFVLLSLFLAPSFMVAWFAVDGYTEQLAATKTLVDLQRRQSGTEALTDLQERAGLLKDVLSQRSLTSILEDVMPRIPDGISVQQIVYSAQGEEISVILKGRAQTRNALISLGDALRLSPLFTHVDVPVSSLAKSTDIDFDVTLVLDVGEQIVEYTEATTTRTQLPEENIGTSSEGIQEQGTSSQATAL